MRAHRGGGAAVSLSADAAYTVGRDAWLRLRGLADGQQLHAQPIGRLPLSCLALLPLQAGAPPGARPAALIGALDGLISLAVVDYGAQRGCLAAHDDAVSALVLPVGCAGRRLLSCSWDGTVKAWDLGEARGFGQAGGGASSPLLELGGDGPLCSLACDAEGATVLVGGADGSVACWDARAHPSGGPAWQVSCSGSGVTALAALPDAALLACACEDGALRLLDTRRGGAQVAALEVGAAAAPCRCVALAGATLLAGADGGQLVAWEAAAAAPQLLRALGPPPRDSRPWRPFAVGPEPLRGVAASPRGAQQPRVAVLQGDGTLSLYATEGWSDDAVDL